MMELSWGCQILNKHFVCKDGVSAKVCFKVVVCFCFCFFVYFKVTQVKAPETLAIADVQGTITSKGIDAFTVMGYKVLKTIRVSDN